MFGSAITKCPFLLKMITNKKCYRCKLILPIINFYIRINNDNPEFIKYESFCKKCNRLRGIKARGPLPERNKFFEINGESWLPIDGFDGIYIVSNLGRVASLYCQKKLRIIQINRGYSRVQLSKNGIDSCHLVHVLMAKAFLPNYHNNPTVNHKLGKKRYNILSQLEWATYKEQYDHAIKIGLFTPPFGENAANSKLKNYEVIEIYNSTLTKRELMSKYGLTRQCVEKIKSGVTYPKVTGHIRP